MLPRNPPGDRWLRDPLFFLGTLLRNTTCIRSPSTPPFPCPPPSPHACGTGAATNRMRASVRMRFWLQLRGLITYAWSI